MNKPIPKELIEELERLETEDQVRVLDYVQSLTSKPKHDSPVDVMKKYVGTISKRDLETMSLAIDRDCSEIDHASWK